MASIIKRLRIYENQINGHAHDVHHNQFSYNWLTCTLRIFLFLIMCTCLPCNGVSRRELISHLDDPEICAFLDMISYAEGTMSENGYRLIYSYEEFTSFNDHPRTIVCAPSNGMTLCSSAAGRYQISQKMWDRIAERIGAKDFSPLNQDCAAVFLLLDRGALQSLKAGKFSEAVNKVRKIWASMPDAPYNQPTKKEHDLYRIYQKQLMIHKNRLNHRRNGGGRP